MNVGVAILGLFFLILVHEAGHFFAGLGVGIRPRRFYLGFGPALAKVRRRGIEYGIAAIPFGGYVKFPGMLRPAPSDADLHFGLAAAESPGVAVEVERLKGALDATDLRAAGAALDGVEEAAAGAALSSSAARALERGLVELRDAIGPDAYWRQRTWKRIVVIVAGPGVNAVLAIALFTAGLMMETGGYKLGFLLGVRGNAAQPVVAQVLRDHPAQRMGLRAGDRIVAVDGRRVASAGAIPQAIGASHGRPITLTVRRGERTLRLGPARPVQQPGVPLSTALGDSFRLSGQVVSGTASAIVHLVHAQARKQISGPVGIVQASAQAASEGARQYVLVLGLVSLSLAILNLLPLLPLDGAHVVFSIVEGLRGRAVAREVYTRVSAVGIAIVLLLLVVGVSNDVHRLGGG